MPATSPVLESPCSTRWSCGGATGVTVQDGFVPGSLCEQLRHQLVPNYSGLSAACKTLEIPVAIPSSLHARVMSLLQTGCVEEANPSELVAQDVVVVPACVSTVGVKLHQDRYGGEERGLVKGLVVVVYIAGGGTMTFVDERSGHVHRQVDIVPGRLIVFSGECAPLFILRPTGVAHLTQQKRALGFEVRHPMGATEFVAADMFRESFQSWLTRQRRNRRWTS